MAAIEFPVLCLHPVYGFVARCDDELTVTTRSGLRRGRYAGLLIVSRSGRAYPIKTAHKIGGAGWFGGWDLFFNQRIRVALIPAAEPFDITLDDLKRRVFESFRTWHGWSSAENFAEIERNVQKAATVSQVIDALS